MDEAVIVSVGMMVGFFIIYYVVWKGQRKEDDSMVR